MQLIREMTILYHKICQGAGIVINSAEDILVENNVFRYCNGSGFWNVRTINTLYRYNLVAYSRKRTDAYTSHVDIYNRGSLYEHNIGLWNEGGFAEVLGYSNSTIMRYSVSVNDGEEWLGDGKRGNKAATIYLSGYSGPDEEVFRLGAGQSYIYNNLVLANFASPQRYLMADGPYDAMIANNIFQTTDGGLETISKFEREGTQETRHIRNNVYTGPNAETFLEDVMVLFNEETSVDNVALTNVDLTSYTNELEEVLLDMVFGDDVFLSDEMATYAEVRDALCSRFPSHMMARGKPYYITPFEDEKIFSQEVLIGTNGDFCGESTTEWPFMGPAFEIYPSSSPTIFESEGPSGSPITSGPSMQPTAQCGSNWGACSMQGACCTEGFVCCTHNTEGWNRCRRSSNDVYTCASIGVEEIPMPSTSPSNIPTIFRSEGPSQSPTGMASDPSAAPTASCGANWNACSIENGCCSEGFVCCSHNSNDVTMCRLASNDVFSCPFPSSMPTISPRSTLPTTSPSKIPTQAPSTAPTSIEELVYDLQARVEFLESQNEKLETMWGYFGCSLDHQSCSIGMEDPALHRAFMSNLKCPTTPTEERLFKLQGSWITVDSCAAKCEDLSDCAYFSMWGNLCIGCTTAPSSYDSRFTSFAISTTPKLDPFYECSHYAESGIACKNSALLWDTVDGPFECMDICRQDSSCTFIEFSWYSKSGYDNQGFCRGLSNCVLEEKWIENEKTIVYGLYGCP